MKVYYFNIFLFSLALNILLFSPQVNNQRNHYITFHTSNTKLPKSLRSLCECELYGTPSYDKDPEMKAVMQDFDRQTSERFKEYDERMVKNRQKCKEKCDKDIKKIILKDKIEKELTETFATLDTNIATNDIPTCVLEKSVADKVEKTCLKCGYGIGSNVSLVGLMSGIGFYTWAVKYAGDCGISAGAKAVASETVKVAIELLTDRIPSLEGLLKSTLGAIVTKNMNSPMHLGMALHGAVQNACTPATPDSLVPPPAICGTESIKYYNLYPKVFGIAGEASEAGKEAGIVAGKAAQAKAWNTAFTWETFFSSSLGISIIVTVCIVVMLIIIYLILSYRRKMKMKKKLKYIKLLKE
ncbi:rifin [Plasmodium sp. gorilla clade G1]|nr:rifin [Plasmodium sp. gorilla clade G1]